jgi:hypothetical protein
MKKSRIISALAVGLLSIVPLTIAADAVYAQGCSAGCHGTILGGLCKNPDYNGKNYETCGNCVDSQCQISYPGGGANLVACENAGTTGCNG